MFKNVILLILFAFSSESFCCGGMVSFGKNTLQYFYSSKTHRCTAMILKNTSDLKRKYFQFTEDGLFMIFYDFGGERNSTSTGSHVFYFQEGSPSFRHEIVNEKLSFCIFQELCFLFSEEGDLIRISKAKFSSSSFENFHISATPLAVADVGFSKGKMKNQNPSGKTRLLLQNGKECEVLNSKLFQYREGEVFRKNVKLERLCEAQPN